MAAIPRDRSILRGLMYVPFGFVLAAAGFVMVVAVPLVALWRFTPLLVPAGTFAPPAAKDYWITLFLACFLIPIGVVLLMFGMKLLRLGIQSMRREGVALADVDPIAYAMSSGEYVHRSLGTYVSPLVVHSGFFFLTLLIALAVAGLLMQEQLEWPPLAAMAAILVVVAGGWAYLGLQGRKFGKSVCRLRGSHARIGGTLAAEVEVEVPQGTGNLPPLPSGPVSAKLQFCTLKGSVTWQAEVSVPLEAIARPGDGTLRIPVRMAIPLDAKDHAGGVWRLRLHAPYPAIDYASVFWPLRVLPPDPPAR